MLVHAMEGYKFKMKGARMENRLDGHNFLNRGLLKVDDLKETVTQMETLFGRAKENLTGLADLGEKQVFLDGFRTLGNYKTFLERAFARFYPTYMADKRQEALDAQGDDDGDGQQQGGGQQQQGGGVNLGPLVAGGDNGAGVGMGASVVDEVFARLHRLRV